uniref:Uncharacterized protein n=1 Tax=Chromera velia CCMP2878 TaxID=1169474 RepID=A0A0G4IFZ5_9ALVE|eukprot:Cvel_2496.t1-p1 / transcript=Cvel_2496.t1 / gene=Cvel_2496 / organism=Chromera_velia_CCMP2878 / gene_product=hypothetical protein / transcript_product=hypothetical protein / location=Cvel_scaffold98:43295-45048(+) / protein_length=168 / sequence_SO=supercontig / SO=protein_coding / is_pseudo=false
MQTITRSRSPLPVSSGPSQFQRSAGGCRGKLHLLSDHRDGALSLHQWYECREVREDSEDVARPPFLRRDRWSFFPLRSGCTELSSEGNSEEDEREKKRVQEEKSMLRTELDQQVQEKIRSTLTESPHDVCKDLQRGVRVHPSFHPSFLASFLPSFLHTASLMSLRGSA